MSRRRYRRRLAAVLLTLASTGFLLVGVTRADAATTNRVDLRVLVVTDGSAGVDVIVAQLDREGVPYDTIDLNSTSRRQLTGTTLSDTVGATPRAKYNGVVLPNESPTTSGLAAPLAEAEMSALATFESTFGVRQVDSYTWAGPNVGLTTAWSGTLDGTVATVTTAAKQAGFGYLSGALSMDDRDKAVSEVYGYLGVANPGVTFTPFLTGQVPGTTTTGSLMGVYAHDGREELVVTLGENRVQTQAELLAHGLVTWVTRGLHLGYWRNYLSVHIDDVLLPDDRWDSAANCTVGDDCNPDRDPAVSPYNTLIRMKPADVTTLVNWQVQQGIKLDLVFNGAGSVDAGAQDLLTSSLVAKKNQFRWINHTYSHPYLGCVQDFTTSPWSCAKAADGTLQYASQADIAAQISDNIAWANSKGLPIDPTELVTGEHSGLKSSPQMSEDNPNLAPALDATGVRVLAADRSRETAPRPVGLAVTVPRYPMSIYYNVARKAEEVDEYNWIYTSRANGGSGICEANPGTTTCITPLSTVTGFTNVIVPTDARITLDHVLTNDPSPHFAHQSNLTEDRILYPVLNEVLTRYRAAFSANTPVVNPRFAQIAALLSSRSAWQAAIAAGSVEAYAISGRVTVVNHGGGRLAVPVTVPAATRSVTVSSSGTQTVGALYGEAYGAERSTWQSLASGGQQLLQLPA